jgi:hypothetical protein
MYDIPPAPFEGNAVKINPERLRFVKREGI